MNVTEFLFGIFHGRKVRVAQSKGGVISVFLLYMNVTEFLFGVFNGRKIRVAQSKGGAK
jgi:hypothetical protein